MHNLALARLAVTKTKWWHREGVTRRLVLGIRHPHHHRHLALELGGNGAVEGDGEAVIRVGRYTCLDKVRPRQVGHSST